jgi:hypothetical protein
VERERARGEKGFEEDKLGELEESRDSRIRAKVKL